MKTRPISFTTDMVQAERAGRKTETRRLNGLGKVNEHPDMWSFHGLLSTVDRQGRQEVKFSLSNEHQYEHDIIACPFGKVGDRLWVKETCWVDNNYMPYLNLPTTVVHYVADEASGYIQALIDGDHMQKIPGRFMYKELSRTTLEIVDIQVQRLCDITEEEALAEGVLFYDENGKRWFKDYAASQKGYGHPEHDYPTTSTAILSYTSLFCKINKGKMEQVLNPWVWVIKFKRVTNEKAVS